MSPHGSPRFLTTRWSVVLSAGAEDREQAGLALEELCRSYWYPLYAYARRHGAEAGEAEDLVQGFFHKLLRTGGLDKADPERGRFRSFLLTGFQRFRLNEAERERALKRGGGRATVSLDGDGEARLRLEPAHETTPERLFLRDWALTVIERALARVGAGYAERGQQALFEAARAFLSGGRGERTQAEAAVELGLSEGAFRVAVTRLRARYRKALRAEIVDTVADDATVDRELGELLAALAL